MINKNRLVKRLRIVFIALLSVFGAACELQNVPQSAPEFQSVNIAEIQFERMGGGQLLVEITRVDSLFKLHVARADFVDTNIDLWVSSLNSNEVYQMLVHAFEDPVSSAQTQPAEDNGAISGTWSETRFYDSSRNNLNIYQRPSFNESLFEDFVRAQL